MQLLRADAGHKAAERVTIWWLKIPELSLLYRILSPVHLFKTLPGEICLQEPGRLEIAAPTCCYMADLYFFGNECGAGGLSWKDDTKAIQHPKPIHTHQIRARRLILHLLDFMKQKHASPPAQPLYHTVGPSGSAGVIVGPGDRRAKHAFTPCKRADRARQACSRGSAAPNGLPSTDPMFPVSVARLTPHPTAILQLNPHQDSVIAQADTSPQPHKQPNLGYLHTRALIAAETAAQKRFLR